MGTKTVLSGVFLAVTAAFFASISPASAATVIPPNTNITGHETWTAANGPYLASSVSVPVGASLTIEPGTVIKGVSTLSVQGTLTVGAAGANKVIFTSYADDAVDGDDTNNDGDATTPSTAGDWGGITVSGNGSVTINDTIFKYGGYSNRYAVQSSGTATVSVSHSEFVYGNNAILIGGGTADVYDTSFHDLGQYGIRQTGGMLRFGRNTFENITSRAVSLEGGATESDGGNIGSGIVYFANRTISGNAVIPKDGFTYYVYGVTVAAGASLTIEPGTVVKVMGTWPIISHGTLTIGSSEPDAEKVIITSYRDDSVGTIVSSTDDGPSVTGDWGGISLAGGTVTVANTAFKYGGISIYASLYNYGAQVSVSHSEFSFGNNAILLEGGGGTTEVYDNAFHDIDQFDIWQKGGALHFGRNTFATPKAQSVYMTAGSLQNDGGNSGTGSIYLSSVTLSEDTILPKDGIPYLFLSLSIPEGRTLGISPGAVVKVLGAVQSSGTFNIGSLDAAAEPVVITSYYDDTVGGDTDRENPVHEPTYDDWSGIAINGGAATIVNTEIRYGGGVYGAQLFVYGGTVLVERTHFQKGGIGIYAAGGTLTLTDSEFSEGKIGLKYHGGTVTMHDNSIHGNSEYGVLNASPSNTELDARNNWWGSPSGPNNLLANTNGTGDHVSDYVLFNPWLSYDPIVWLALRQSSVLFLPGLEASRLYEGDEQRWEPGSDADAERLLMNPDTSQSEHNIHVGGVIDNAYVSVKGNVYKSFIEDMDAQGLFIKEWKALAYDWRKSFDSLLADDSVKNTLTSLAADSYTGKVTIIAHSNGGLLAKKLIDSLSNDEKKLVDKLVLVAVPQSGTPQAIGALLHGYDQGLPTEWMPFAFSDRMARTLAKNMPSAYPLLPSSEYFSDRSSSDRAVITFEDGIKTNPFISEYGHKIDTVSDMYRFLRDENGKVEADSDDIVSPAKVNAGRLSEAKAVHDEIDSWHVPDGIEIYQIAGYGEDTLEGVHYWTGLGCQGSIGFSCYHFVPKLYYTPIVAADGDGTVKASSALAMSGKKYWVDLNAYNKPNPIISREHADILEIDSLRNFIKNNILAKSSELPNYISDSTPSIDTAKRFQFFLHSPLALSIKDADGHIVSATTADIPGARYKRFGEVQYISVPASVHPTVVLDGEAEGSFTLEVKEVVGDTVTAETTFAAIPNTADTQVTMDFPDGTIEHADPLVIDYDGNGETDLSLEPKIGEVVTTEPADIVAPTTTVSLSGIQGTNGWYTGDVTVTLTVTEDGSGVDKTEYSFDGTNWTAYVDPFTIFTEGTTTLQYRSIDKAGNQEGAKTEAVKIDKTKPIITGTASPVAMNGWNITDVTVSFTCQDGQSGIGTDTVTGATLATEGKDQSVTNAGECIDQAGNQADTVTVSGINIDKTAPEAKISFNKDTRKLDIIGMDTLSAATPSETVQTAGTKVMRTVTLTDQAGHTTKLILSHPNLSLGQSIIETVESIAYDGTTTSLSDTHLLYAWAYNEKTKKYSTFASTLNAGAAFVDVLFSPYLNITILLERTPSGSLSLKYRSGMVVSYMETEKGNIKVKY